MVEEFPPKLGLLLFEFPDISTLIVDLQFQNSTRLIDALKMSTSGSADSALLPSVQELTIRDDKWQFLAHRCPNLHSLTVSGKSAWRSAAPLLDIGTLGGLHPRLRKLDCPEICEQNVLKGM